MMHPNQVCDGRTYLQFRSEWRAVYSHLTEMIRRRKSIRRVHAGLLGEADSKYHAVSKRRPNTEVRQKRLIRFADNVFEARAHYRDADVVCRRLRHEARNLMHTLEEVKARRPAPKAVPGN